jgi:LAS superfamily LD-carboxypeptidase LdcB
MHQSAVIAAHNEQDPAKRRQMFAQLLTNPEVSDTNKQLANRYIADDYINEKKLREAEKKVETATPTELSRYLKERNEEGSYVKAIVFQRLGLTEAAKEEQRKLGYGRNMTSEMLGNDRYSVVRNADGSVSKAFDNKGNEVDQDTVARLSAESLAMKGAVTGGTFGHDQKGNIWSHTTIPGTNKIIWTNQSNGETSNNAPAGYAPMGQKTIERLQEEKGVNTAGQIETKMRKANSDAALMNLPQPYSEDQIAAEKAKITKAAPATAGGTFSDPSIKVISGYRPTAQQQTIWDESVAAGRPGKTAQGYPIAVPGTSAHETDNAKDIDSKSLTKSGRQELGQKGWYQPDPTASPNHWERTERTGTAPTASAAPTGTTASIAQKIANYEMKPPASRSATYGPLMLEVSRLNPEYDETKFATVQQTRKNFTTGKQGDTVRSMNVAVDHLDTLDKAAQALNNGDLPILNKVMNDFSKNTGHPAVTNFDGIKSIVGSEVAKAVSGAGGSALGDREEIRREINAANSYDQLNGVIKKYQELMVGQLKGLKVQYEDSGLKDFDKKLAEPTKRVLGRVDKESKTTRSNW